MTATGHTRVYCHKGHKLRLLNYENPRTLRELFYYGLHDACYLLVHLGGIKYKYEEIYRNDVKEIWNYYRKKYYQDRNIGGYWGRKYFKREK